MERRSSYEKFKLFKKNIENINKYSEIVDHNFVTTHPSV